MCSLRQNCLYPHDKNGEVTATKPVFPLRQNCLTTINNTIKETTADTTATPAPLPAGGQAPALLTTKKTLCHSLAVPGRMVSLSRFMHGCVMSFWTERFFIQLKRRRFLRKIGCGNIIIIVRTVVWAIRRLRSLRLIVFLRLRLRLNLRNTRQKTRITL